MKNIVTLTIFILLINTFCYGQNTYEYAQPKNLEDGWKTINLQSLRVDTTKIYKLFNQLYRKENKLHSILLVKNGKIVIEEYFKNHSVNRRHDLRSTTKSIRSILLGIAIDKGFIDSIDDPISKYLISPVPIKNIDERKDKITIKHLLTMSAGFDCNDWDKKSKGQEDRVHKTKNWLQYTLNLPMVNEPGVVSNYCSMGTVLIAEIISQASGMAIDEFAKQHLFNPLNISNVKWDHTSNKKVIASAKRLYMTSRDMAKIGQLILDHGKWNEKQIVSKKWIEESTTPKTKITEIDYGYLWWNIPFKYKEQIIVSKAATGNGGQYIIIFPELNIVAIFTGGAYNSEEQMLPFVIMNEIFLPTFMSGQKT